MKRLLFLIIILHVVLVGQEYTNQESVKAMEKLNVMVGIWEGDSWHMGREGKQSSTMKESIEYKLDGTALFIEGKGFKGDKLVHNALGIISFNPFSKTYDMMTYLSSGRSTKAKLVVLDEGMFSWSFDTPNGMKFRYDIKNDGKTWVEEGFMARDGKNFVKFMGMTLNKVK